MEIRVGGIFKVVKKIDEGAFGEIYRGVNTKNQMEVAIKF